MERREALVRLVLVADEVVLLGEIHERLGQEEAVGVRHPAVADREEVGGRIDQQLERRLHAVVATACCATIAARLPPALSPPTAMRVGVDAEALRVLGDPFPRRPAVVERGRERRLGCEPVVDRDDPDLRLLGEEPAQRVVAVEVAVDPATAVEEHQRRRRT